MSGTIIAAAFTATSIAALRAYSGIISPVCQVEGYYKGSDGGEGVFWYNASDTTSADNGGTIIVDAANRRWYRETGGVPVSVRWFGAKGDGTTNDQPVIAAAITYVEGLGGGTVLFPFGNYRINSGLTVSTSNVILLSEGVGAATIIFAATTGFAVTFTGTTDSGVHGITFTSGEPTSIAGTPTAGAAILFTGNGFHNFAEWVTCTFTFDGIHVVSASETRLVHIKLRYFFGLFGVYYAGTVSLPSFRLIIDDIIADNPYPSEPSADSQIKSYAASAPFNQFDVVFENGCVFQCVQAGTTGASSAPTNPGSFTLQITDGSVKWQFVCADLTWITMDNYAFSLVIDKASLVDGCFAFRMIDSANTGTSYPTWVDNFDLECDHNFTTGVSLEAGFGFYMVDGWISSTLNGNGIFIGDAAFGEVTIGPGTRIFGCAQNGLLYNTGVNVLVSGAFVAANSESSANTYHGLNMVSTGGGFFAITDCAIGGSPGGSGVQGYGILIGTAAVTFSITTNVLTGNGTGAISNSSTPGPDQIIANNAGYVTQNSGQGTVLSGQTTLAVAHGLAQTPTPAGIMVTANSACTSSGGNAEFWVTAVGATTFTVTTSATLNLNFDFSWNARLGDA